MRSPGKVLHSAHRLVVSSCDGEAVFEAEMICYCLGLGGGEAGRLGFSRRAAVRGYTLDFLSLFFVWTP